MFTWVCAHQCVPAILLLVLCLSWHPDYMLIVTCAGVYRQHCLAFSLDFSMVRWIREGMLHWLGHSGNCCNAAEFKKLFSHQAFTFLAWLLGRFFFILPLFWDRHCKNRHTGNRPSLSEEPLRRGGLDQRPDFQHWDIGQNTTDIWIVMMFCGIPVKKVAVSRSFKSFNIMVFFCFFKYETLQPVLMH